MPFVGLSGGNNYGLLRSKYINGITTSPRYRNLSLSGVVIVDSVCRVVNHGMNVLRCSGEVYSGDKFRQSQLIETECQGAVIKRSLVTGEWY
jgi:hypothetical protein